MVDDEKMKENLFISPAQEISRCDHVWYVTDLFGSDVMWLSS